MTDYSAVTSELDRGTPPELLCATCPWNRPCITPPTMTKRDIEQRVKEMAAPGPMAELGDAKSNPLGGLLGALMFAGKDTAAQVCPVFVLRLSSEDGRAIADGIRNKMRNWPGIEDPS